MKWNHTRRFDNDFELSIIILHNWRLGWTDNLGVHDFLEANITRGSGAKPVYPPTYKSAAQNINTDVV